MRTRMPPSVRIGTTDFTIGRRKNGEDSGYFCVTCKPQISVRYGLPTGNAPTVLVHEIVHAGCYEYGINLRESQIDGMTHVFLQLIRNNPELIDYLIKTKQP